MTWRNGRGRCVPRSVRPVLLPGLHHRVREARAFVSHEPPAYDLEGPHQLLVAGVQALAGSAVGRREGQQGVEEYVRAPSLHGHRVHVDLVPFGATGFRYQPLGHAGLRHLVYSVLAELYAVVHGGSVDLPVFP